MAPNLRKDTSYLKNKNYGCSDVVEQIGCWKSYFFREKKTFCRAGLEQGAAGQGGVGRDTWPAPLLHEIKGVPTTQSCGCCCPTAASCHVTAATTAASSSRLTAAASSSRLTAAVSSSRLTAAANSKNRLTAAGVSSRLTAAIADWQQLPAVKTDWAQLPAVTDW